MIAFVCQFYGWGYQEVLDIPMKAFVLFHQEAMKLETAQFREYLYISCAPHSKKTFIDELENKYNRVLNPKSFKKPEKPPEMQLQAGSAEARDLMFALSRVAKRGFRG